MKFNDKCYYVYIVTNCKRGVIYIGITGNLINRIYQHRVKLIEGFTKKYNLDKLVYYEIINSPLEAISREKQLKKWNRNWKLRLIENFNPTWEDLYLKVLNS